MLLAAAAAIVFVPPVLPALPPALTVTITAAVATAIAVAFTAAAMPPPSLFVLVSIVSSQQRCLPQPWPLRLLLLQHLLLGLTRLLWQPVRS